MKTALLACALILFPAFSILADDATPVPPPAPPEAPDTSGAPDAPNPPPLPTQN